MTRQDVPPLLTLSGAFLEAHWDRVGHSTLSDRCTRPVGREKQKKPPCLIFGTRTIQSFSSAVHPLWRSYDQKVARIFRAEDDDREPRSPLIVP